MTCSCTTETGQTARVSVASDGAEGNRVSYEAALSADGRYVTFTSSAANFVVNDTNGVQDVLFPSSYSINIMPAMSADGRYIAFSFAGSDLVGSDTKFPTASR